MFSWPARFHGRNSFLDAVTEGDVHQNILVPNAGAMPPPGEMVPLGLKWKQDRTDGAVRSIKSLIGAITELPRYYWIRSAIAQLNESQPLSYGVVLDLVVDFYDCFRFHKWVDLVASCSGAPMGNTLRNQSVLPWPTRFGVNLIHLKGKCLFFSSAQWTILLVVIWGLWKARPADLLRSILGFAQSSYYSLPLFSI